MNYVIFLGLCQALIALLLLPAARAKRPANEWLRWLLACICLHLTFKFIIFTTVPYVEMRRTFNTFVGLAYGPLLWIFAQKVHNDRFKPFRYWYAFLPALIGAFGYLFVAISTMVHGRLPLVFLDIYNKYVLYCSYLMVIFPILTLRVSGKLAAFWNIERRLLRQFSAILITLCGVAVIGTLLPYVKGLDQDNVGIAIRIFVYAQLMVGCVLIIQYELSLQRVLGQTMHEQEPAGHPVAPASQALAQSAALVQPPVVAEFAGGVIASAIDHAVTVNTSAGDTVMPSANDQAIAANAFAGGTTIAPANDQAIATNAFAGGATITSANDQAIAVNTFTKGTTSASLNHPSIVTCTAIYPEIVPQGGIPTLPATVPPADHPCIATPLADEDMPARKSLLDNAQLISLKMRLTQLMEKQRLFTDPELSLEKLAALLQVPRNQASELINQGIGKSFYQYINEYRIREVVRLLDKCARHGVAPNILSLAFEAGFNSKSSFNTYFKKVTGDTPSAYLKRDQATRLLAGTGYC